MARPKKSPQENRAEQVSIRLSPLELATLRSKADTAKTNVTAFVRAAALGQRVSVTKSTAPDFATRHELRRIGVNLNQIARALHEGRGHDPHELLALCAKLDTLFDGWLDHGSQGHKQRP